MVLSYIREYRKRKEASETPYPKVHQSLRLPKAMLDEVEAEARLHHVSVGRVIRDALRASGIGAQIPERKYETRQ